LRSLSTLPRCPLFAIIKVMLMSFILCSLTNSLAILMSAWVIKSVNFTGSLVSLIIAGAILATANMILKPVLKILSFPVIIFTFGIFSFFISMTMLWITDQLMVDLSINSFSALLLTTILVGFFNILIYSKKAK